MTATALVPTAKPRNPYRISAKAALENADILSLDELDSSVVPACCSEGCEVEPDSRCDHGCPSVLLAHGLI